MHCASTAISVEQPRLDFASILDYGNAKTGMSNNSDKQKFVNMIEKMEDAKDKATEVKAKVANKK